MTQPINIYLVKTTHIETPTQSQYDPSELYTDEHVYEIKKQLDIYFTLPYKFNLLTNDTVIGMPDINFHYIGKEDLWGWWNKMLLFRKDISGPGLNIYLDLDTTIQRNIDMLVDYAVQDKLTMLYCYWKPIDWEKMAYPQSGYDPTFRYATLINSSIMMWYGQDLEYITDDFMIDCERHMFQFRGNDEYMYRYHKDIINCLPRGWVYSWFFGAEEGSEFFPKDKDMFKKRNQYYFRLLNGEGKRMSEMEATRQPGHETKKMIQQVKGNSYGSS